MSALARALLAELTDADLDVLAERLAPRLADLVAQRQANAGGQSWLRGAAEIAAYIGAKTSRVYALSSAGRIPVHRDGSALVARVGELDDWLQSGGGRRP